MGPPGPLTTGTPPPPGNGHAAPERRVVLASAANFRDLGGYRTRDGRTVRWRQAFRADDLSHLTAADRDMIRALGVSTVIDLRSDAEVRAQRFPVEDIPVGFHHLPLLARLPGFSEFTEGPAFFARHYLEIAQRSGDQIATAATIVAQDAHPVVVHCAAGKDRTGIVAAVLLALLGVDDETIAQDYALSAHATDALLASLLERLPDQRAVIEPVAAALFSSTPANILALLDGIRAEHGSVEAYAAAHGAGADVVAALRDALLE